MNCAWRHLDTEFFPKPLCYRLVSIILLITQHPNHILVVALAGFLAGGWLVVSLIRLWRHPPQSVEKVVEELMNKKKLHPPDRRRKEKKRGALETANLPIPAMKQRTHRNTEASTRHRMVKMSRVFGSRLAFRIDHCPFNRRTSRARLAIRSRSVLRGAGSEKTARRGRTFRPMQ